LIIGELRPAIIVRRSLVSSFGLSGTKAPTEPMAPLHSAAVSAGNPSSLTSKSALCCWEVNVKLFAQSHTHGHVRRLCWNGIAALLGIRSQSRLNDACHRQFRSTSRLANLMIRALFLLHFNDVSNESCTGERLDIGDRAARFLAPAASPRWPQSGLCRAAWQLISLMQRWARD